MHVTIIVNPLRPILIIFMYMHKFNAMYLVYEVAYVKTDFAILFSREKAFFHYQVFFISDFAIDSSMYYE